MSARQDSLLTYAGIGSRSTPADILSVMQRIAKQAASGGYTLRSGGAAGADSAFETGAGQAKEIYLPWPGFKGHPSPLCEPSEAAMAMAAQFHPAWARCSQGARRMHARNCHQILGADLDSPVAFVACWTAGGAGGGGTGQALRIAHAHAIPVFDLAVDDHPAALVDRIGDWLPEDPAGSMRLVDSLLDYTRPWSLPDVYLFTGNPVRRHDGALVMGRGAARCVRDAYPGIDKLIPTDAPVTFTEVRPEQFIGWFKVKDHWAAPAKLDLIEASAEYLARIARARPGRTFHLNAPGIGNGGLSWSAVSPALACLPGNVLVYR